MVDQLVVFAPGGQVLYKYTARKLPDSVVNGLIGTVLIGGLGNDGGSHVGTFNLSGFTTKYLRVNNPDFTIVAVYASATPLSYVDKLVSVLSVLFKELFSEQLLANIAADVPITSNIEEEQAKFEQFVKVKLAEMSNDQVDLKEDNDEGQNIIQNSNGNKSTKNVNVKGKKLRKWGADGSATEEDSNFALDFSTGGDVNNSNSKIEINQDDIGNKDTKTGNFLVKDLNEEMEELLANSTQKKEVKEPFGFLKKFTGGKTITEQDIKSTLVELQNHLIKKNVAPEVAQHLTSNVEKALVGSKTKNWTSIKTTANEALAKSLTNILTPGTSVNLLEDIKANGKQQPYVISVVGVNGVGKSTNLSKLAYWLLQNNFRVLIVACDTFRSGAVEQLRVHVNNLKNSSENKDSIELFEGGYGGSDLVAKIAKNAIDYGKKQGFDIILMDTAGRRHNDARLMAPLESFAKAAKPNKIIMVGEALVGTDSVQQAKNFNKAFGAGRTLDFFIISKCDTVGDLIGTMVNMVYATNIPILFVGVGQTYTDLRTLSVEWAVNTLMS